MLKETEEFLNSYPDSMSKVAKELCQRVTDCAPDANEKVQPGWKVVTYRYEKDFCAVAPHKNCVNLQFHAGAHLTDPKRLLEGTGKSMRHAKIRSSDDINDDVNNLIQAAAAYAVQTKQ